MSFYQEYHVKVHFDETKKAKAIIEKWETLIEENMKISGNEFHLSINGKISSNPSEILCSEEKSSDFEFRLQGVFSGNYNAIYSLAEETNRFGNEAYAVIGYDSDYGVRLDCYGASQCKAFSHKTFPQRMWYSGDTATLYISLPKKQWAFKLECDEDEIEENLEERCDSALSVFINQTQTEEIFGEYEFEEAEEIECINKSNDACLRAAFNVEKWKYEIDALEQKIAAYNRITGIITELGGTMHLTLDEDGPEGGLRYNSTEEFAIIEVENCNSSLKIKQVEVATVNGNIVKKALHM